MEDASTPVMIEALAKERSMRVEVSSGSDEDEETLLRDAAERVVNDEDDLIVQARSARGCAQGYSVVPPVEQGTTGCGRCSTV